MLLGLHFTGTRVGSRGSCLEISEDGMKTSKTVQEIVFLKDPKSSEVVAGDVEAPVSSVGSVQNEAVQQRWCLGRPG